MLRVSRATKLQRDIIGGHSLGIDPNRTIGSRLHYHDRRHVIHRTHDEFHFLSQDRIWGSQSQIILIPMTTLAHPYALRSIDLQQRVVDYSARHKLLKCADRTVRVETLREVTPQIHLLHNFLSEEEADHLQTITMHSYQRSLVGDSVSFISDSRTSYSALVPTNDPILRRILMRVASAAGCRADQLETPVETVRYINGQQFQAHTDYFQSIHGRGRQGQRIKTFVLYLTEGLSSREAARRAHDGSDGATAFTKLGIRVQPRKCAALMFEDADPVTGIGYELSEHMAAPPPAGMRKVVCNIWVRQYTADGRPAY